MQAAVKKYSQQEVLNSIQKKDAAAFGILYDTYAQVIFGVINKITPDNTLAEEILQKSFVKIWQDLSLFDAAKQRLIAWMLMIARNTANDVIKKTGINSNSQIQQLNNTVNLYNKDVLALVYFKGYSLKMAAEAMNITIEEAKLNLKKELDQIRTAKVK